MDAYMANPNDWVVQKLEEKNNGAEKYDYANANMDSEQLVLTGTWVLILIVFGYFFVKDAIIGNWDILSSNYATQKNVFR
mmetsp:Transcript_40422/g.41068  ORF Transcript_40422/g.41068 Transcript_40422/m.41068 type:complete len:80 (+) Transcript_40422:187-426(+)